MNQKFVVASAEGMKNEWQGPARAKRRNLFYVKAANAGVEDEDIKNWSVASSCRYKIQDPLIETIMKGRLDGEEKQR